MDDVRSAQRDPIEVRLLVIDDDPDVAATLVLAAEALSAAGRSIANPAELEAEIARWRPTHIAIDLNMPGEDGVSVLRRLARSRFEGRIIIASGMERRVVRAANRIAQEEGLTVAGELGKPFAIERLRQLLAPHPRSDAAPNGRRERTETSDAVLTDRTISAAMLADEFWVAFQPKIDLADRRPVGFEALARWTSPELGVVRPDVFIAAAERTGTIDRLTWHVFERALAGFRELHGAWPGMHLALNVSATTLTDEGWVTNLLDVVERSGVAVGAVTLELTESAAAPDPHQALAILTRCRLHGFGLALDDFGTGTSTLTQLVRQPFTELKIDQGFVRNLPHDRDAEQVTRAVTALGIGLGLDVTAEGIETDEVRDWLTSLGCQYGQGFGIARPMLLADARDWMVSKL